jgi:hypothetical protein
MTPEELGRASRLSENRKKLAAAADYLTNPYHLARGRASLWVDVSVENVLSLRVPSGNLTAFLKSQIALIDGELRKLGVGV